MHRSRPKPVPVRSPGTPPAAPPPAIVPELDNADREDLRSFRRYLPCIYCKAPISDLPCCSQCQDES